MTISRLTTFCGLLCLTALQAQDVAPNQRAAVRHVVGSLARQIPSISPAPSSIRVLPRGGGNSDRELVLSALKDENFILASDSADPRTLEVLVWSEREASGQRRFLLETVGDPPQRFTCLFGDAEWVDESSEGKSVFASPWTANAASARSQAMDIARASLQHRVGLANALPSDVKNRIKPSKVFVAATTADGPRLYKAYVEVDSSKRALSRIRSQARASERAERWEPAFRGGAMIGASLLLFFFYLRADWATRGYMTGRLRAVFGIVTALAWALCWRFPL